MKFQIVRDFLRKRTIWRNSMKTMENLIKKAKEEKTLDWKESIDLVQYLLDTEKVTEYPEFEQLCNYYITEGLCYYVPS